MDILQYPGEELDPYFRYQIPVHQQRHFLDCGTIKSQVGAQVHRMCALSMGGSGTSRAWALLSFIGCSLAFSFFSFHRHSFTLTHTQHIHDDRDALAYFLHRTPPVDSLPIMFQGLDWSPLGTYISIHTYDIYVYIYKRTFLLSFNCLPFPTT